MSLTTQLSYAGPGAPFGIPTGRGAVVSRLRATITAVGDALSQSSAEIKLLSNGILAFTASGVLTLTSAPTIPDGDEGQLIFLLNVGANAVTLQDEGTLAGSNLELSATTLAIASRCGFFMVFSVDLGGWVLASAPSAVL